MFRRNLAFFIALVALPLSVHAAKIDNPDARHSVAGDEDVVDELGSSKSAGNSPFIVEGESPDNVENSKASGEDYIFDHGVKEVSGKVSTKKKYEDFGYTAPGTFENQENYIEVDRPKIAKELGKSSSAGFNLSFIKNDFDYKSEDDIINRTIGEGYKSMKGGTLILRNDTYFSKSMLLNTFWSAGVGLGYNTGRGVFKVGGARSDTKFSLWEIPVEAGLGLEIPISSWFKISGVGGPGVLGLIQNRSDVQRGEKGKRKMQYSVGYFANAQFKINLYSLSDESAYELFTTSDITNVYLNLEARHENYGNFQDDITISGTSFGIGFTFEYL